MSSGIVYTKTQLGNFYKSLNPLFKGLVLFENNVTKLNDIHRIEIQGYYTIKRITDSKVDIFIKSKELNNSRNVNRIFDVTSKIYLSDFYKKLDDNSYIEFNGNKENVILFYVNDDSDIKMLKNVYWENLNHVCKDDVIGLFRNVVKKDKLNPTTVNNYGYHLTDIKKGVLGELSKIQEEIDEIKDAELQNNKIMIGCELSDLYGAIEAYASNYSLTMNDLKIMSDATKRAFESGRRVSHKKEDLTHDIN